MVRSESALDAPSNFRAAPALSRKQREGAPRCVFRAAVECHTEGFQLTLSPS